MKFSKGVVIFLVGLLITSLFFVLSTRKITGNYIWGPESVVLTCSNEDIGNLWEEIFNEPFQNAIIFNESGLVCSRFLATKEKVGGEVFVLFEEYLNNEVENVTKVKGYYLNLTEGCLNQYHSSLGNYEELLAFVGGLPAGGTCFKTWAIENSSSAEAKLGEIFLQGLPDSLTLRSDGLFVAEDIETGERKNSSYLVEINKTSAFAFLYSYSQNSYGGFVPVIIITQRKMIDNFTFEMNSSWNDAIDLDDYFSVNYGGLNFSAVTEGNNTNGAWINWSIGTDNHLRFKPAVNFTGKKSFKVKVNATAGVTNDSNEFFVEIITKINHAPKLKENFEGIFLKVGEEKFFDLENYFEDNDDKNLFFRTTNETGLVLNLNGSILGVSLGTNFSEEEGFYVYASDGKDEIKSNRVRVFFEEGLFNGSILVPPTRNLSMVLNQNSSGRGNSTNQEDVPESRGFIFWGFVVVISLFFLGGISILIYMFFFKQGVVENVVEESLVTNNYLTNLNEENFSQTAVQTKFAQIERGGNFVDEKKNLDKNVELVKEKNEATTEDIRTVGEKVGENAGEKRNLNEKKEFFEYGLDEENEIWK